VSKRLGNRSVDATRKKAATQGLKLTTLITLYAQQDFDIAKYFKRTVGTFI